tara:strand:+ start:15 stop:233 length:219 start_codon:yes stop_codon:yes gene_type:complete
MEDLGRVFFAIIIVAGAILLIFLVFIPMTHGLDKLGKKINMDGFIGWLIGAVAFSIGLIILTFGTEFLFNLG